MYLLGGRGVLNSIHTRGVFLSKKFLKVNREQTLVYLRSPKHFNIGKQRIISFNNYKSFLLITNVAVHINTLMDKPNFFKKLANLQFKNNILFKINSVVLSTTFKVR